MWPNDLCRDLAKEDPIPRPEHFIAGTSAEKLDHDEGLVDLAARREIPRFWDRTHFSRHLLVLRSSEWCTCCASSRRRGLPVWEPSSRKSVVALLLEELVWPASEEGADTDERASESKK